MRVSTRGDYACRALLSLALHGGSTPTSVKDIAERTGLPQPYLEQILLALKGAGLVRSKRGVGGGYVLARPPEKLTLGQVVAAVDGPIVVGDFGEPHAGGACDHEGQCVLLSVWAEVGEHMRAHLDSYTIADMVGRVKGADARRQPFADRDSGVLPGARNASLLPEADRDGAPGGQGSVRASGAGEELAAAHDRALVPAGLA